MPTQSDATEIFAIVRVDTFSLAEGNVGSGVDWRNVVTVKGLVGSLEKRSPKLNG